MGKVGKLLSLVVTAVLVLIAVYLGMRSFASWRQGYGWSEMDWNQDGQTSIGEFFVSSDIGKRQTNRNGGECTEYYSFSDGLSVKVVCPQ